MLSRRWIGIGNVPGSLGAVYVQGNDIDASAAAAGTGFIPVGRSGTPFADSFDGRGHTIDGLVTDRPRETSVSDDTDAGDLVGGGSESVEDTCS